MKTAMKVLVTCALALSAPALAQSRANCTEGCTVYVSVPAGCGSGIHVSMDPIFIKVGGKPATITWEVQPPNSPWKFADVGIHIINFDAAAFDSRPVKAGTTGKQFTATNKPGRAGVYKYDINLVREIGKDAKGPKYETCTLDPTVINW